MTSTSSLPSYIDAQKWADRDAVIEQVVVLSAFTRVCEAACSDQGSVQIACRVGRDAQNLVRLTGHLSTRLSMVCQRCLAPVDVDLDAKVALFLLRVESDADVLPEDADYLVLDDEGRIALLDVLEDELILALPLVAAHENCEPYQMEAAAEASAPTAARENPFQALAGLNTARDENDC